MSIQTFCGETVALTCGTCGAPFAMAVEVYATRVADHQSFWCPLGHERYFPPGKSREQKLAEQLDAERARAEFWRARCADVEHDGAHPRRGRLRGTGRHRDRGGVAQRPGGEVVTDWSDRTRVPLEALTGCEHGRVSNAPLFRWRGIRWIRGPRRGVRVIGRWE